MSIKLFMHKNELFFLKPVKFPAKMIQLLKYTFALLFTLCLYGLSTSQSHAACTVTGNTTQTYTYNAGNINSVASITFTGKWTCYSSSINSPGTSRYICAKAAFSGQTTSNSSKVLAYSITNFSIGGLNRTSPTNNVWYGPATTISSNSVLDYSITVAVPAQTGSLIVNPKGTYTGTMQLYMDMQQNNSSSCEGNSGGGWDSDNEIFTFNYVIPSFCQFNSTNEVNFGKITDIGTTKSNYDANGAVLTTCNTGTPYSIYLGNGNNYSSSSRRMMNSSNYLPYQLYKESARTNIWDATGGTTTLGGSGGVSLTGTGTSQNTPVYGRIAQGTTLPPPGDYVDTVVVTVTY